MYKKIIREALALVLIAFAAVLCLSVVYEMTKAPIAAAEAEEKLDSYRAVLDGADTFEAIGEEKLSAFSSPVEGVSVTEACIAKREDGEALGAVLSVTTTKGYGGEIVLSVGILPDGTIAGVRVTSMSETVGLGAECQNEEWISQFAGICADEIIYTKTGKSAENEIDAISSATKTTKAVTGAVNGALAFAREVLGYGGKGE